MILRSKSMGTKAMGLPETERSDVEGGPHESRAKRGIPPQSGDADDGVIRA